jgi:hypothetical protein
MNVQLFNYSAALRELNNDLSCWQIVGLVVVVVVVVTSVNNV